MKPLSRFMWFAFASSLAVGDAWAVVLGPEIPLPYTAAPCPYMWCGPGVYYLVTSVDGAAAASDGTDFLAIWSERRFDVEPGSGGEPGLSIPAGTYALRVGADGTVLDPSPILLAAESMGGRYLGMEAAFARLSGVYLVFGFCDDGPCATRITREGLVLDASPFPLPAGTFGFDMYAGAPHIVSDGTDFLLFYGGQLVRVSAEGFVMDGSPIPLPCDGVASDGTHLLVVWREPATSDLLTTLIDWTGAAVNPVPILLATDADAPEVIFDGTDFVVVWQDWRGTSYGTITGAQVTTAGDLLAGSETVLVSDSDISSFPYAMLEPSFDGRNGLLGWVDCPDCEPLLPHGAVFGTPSGLLVAGEIFDPGGRNGMDSMELASNDMGNTLFVHDGAEDEIYWRYFPRARVVTTWVPLMVSTPGTGEGRVTSVPAGIDCGAICTAQFDAPTVVTLTATPAEGSRFLRWGGACAGTGPTCVTIADAAKAVEAAFVPADVTPPRVSAPVGLQVFATRSDGALVSFTATAVDDVSGPLAATCSPEPGSLFAPGLTRVLCAATDAAGNTGWAAFDVEVIFAASSVLPPVEADGTSVFRLGRTVPIKFALLGASAGITDLVATLHLTRISSEVTGTVEAALASATADAGDAFRYDPIAGIYVFNLATRGLSEGTWELALELGDGVVRTVTFSLRS